MADRKTFIGGTHYHYYTPPDREELALQNKDAVIPARFYPKEKELITKLAEKRGRSNSDFIRDVVLKYLKSEKTLNQLRQLLDDIIA